MRLTYSDARRGRSRPISATVAPASSPASRSPPGPQAEVGGSIRASLTRRPARPLLISRRRRGRGVESPSESELGLGGWPPRRCSPGPRTPVKSPFCSIDTWRRSSATQCSSSHRSMSIRSSAICSMRAGSCSGARSGPSTTYSPPSGSRAGNCGNGRSPATPRAALLAPAGRRGAARASSVDSARFGGFAETLGRALGGLESGLSRPGGAQRRVRPLRAAYRAELDRLGLCDREGGARPCGRAACRGVGRLGRATGVRLRVRGPHRRRVGASGGSRGPRPRSRSRSHTSLAGSRSRRSPARSKISHELAGGEDRRATWGAGDPCSRSRRSRGSSGASSRTTAAPARHWKVLGFLEGAGPRGLLELVGEEILSLHPFGHPCRGDRGRLCLGRAVAGGARGRVRAFGVPYTVEGAASSRSDGVRRTRSRRCFASRGSAESGGTCSR